MSAHRHYQLVEQTIRFMKERHRDQPSLEELAERVHLSPYHFQRIFTEWAGISPKRFLQYLTKEYLLSCLDAAGNLDIAAEQAGLSSQSRVHDLFVTLEALTPQEVRTQGQGVTIDWGIHDSPFGACFIGTTARGVCALQFVEGLDREAFLADFAKQWRGARIQHNPVVTGPVIQQLFDWQVGPAPVSVLVKGSNFQLKVWSALLAIPAGSLCSYQQLARAIGQPSASRAVGSAVSKNPVAVLIPCHRVIRQQGVVGEYRWGAERKTALIGWEAAQNMAGSDKKP